MTMQSKATTVREYLAQLPADRKATLEAIRATIVEYMDKSLEEGMQYGMIGYYVPHRLFPAGYHCDPKQPLPFAGLASQKNYCSLYLMPVYGDSEIAAWFTAAWKATGRKLDMGKACIRFKRLEDVPLDVLAALLRRTTVKGYIARYQATLGRSSAASSGAATAKSAAAAKTTSKSSPKSASKAPAKSAAASASKVAAATTPKKPASKPVTRAAATAKKTTSKSAAKPSKKASSTARGTRRRAS
jgi:hypothetical protein